MVSNFDALRDALLDMLNTVSADITLKLPAF
jgi:hypothetical protein